MDFNRRLGRVGNDYATEGCGAGGSEVYLSQGLKPNSSLADRLQNPALAKQVMGEMHAELQNQFGATFYPEHRSESDKDAIFLRWVEVLKDGPNYVEIGRRKAWDEAGPVILKGRGYDFSFDGMRDQFERDWEEAYVQRRLFEEAVRAGKIKIYKEKMPAVRRLSIAKPTDEDLYGLITTYNAQLFEQLK